jgi:uncharacterized damage-inducible protein DinB
VTPGALLADAFGRIRSAVDQAVDGLAPDDLARRVDGAANSIGWLIWHLTRIQDDHVAEVAGLEQVWTSKGWADQFGLAFDVSATGYGHSSDDVAAVRPQSGELLTGYHHAVSEHTVQYVTTLDSGDLDRIVDEHWDPPVTLGARLISVISDDLQHAGQAGFVRGLIERG